MRKGWHISVYVGNMYVSDLKGILWVRVKNELQWDKLHNYCEWFVSWLGVSLPLPCNVLSKQEKPFWNKIIPWETKWIKSDEVLLRNILCHYDDFVITRPFFSNAIMVHIILINKFSFGCDTPRFMVINFYNSLFFLKNSWEL